MYGTNKKVENMKCRQEHYTTINVKIHGGVLKINWENVLGFHDI